MLLSIYEFVLSTIMEFIFKCSIYLVIFMYMTTIINIIIIIIINILALYVFGKNITSKLPTRYTQ
jgi:hypothetical protein